MREPDEISGEIVDAALRLHRRLGPGLLESVYEKVLKFYLERRGLKVEQQKNVPFNFEGLHFDRGLRVDLLVESLVVVEVKSIERTTQVHMKQLSTYLRLLGLPIGLLLNFGCLTLREDLHRIVNDLPHSPNSPLRVNRLPRR